MPYKSNNTNQRGSENKGNPTGRGSDSSDFVNSKAGIKDAGLGASDPDLNDALSAKYLEEDGKPDEHLTKHPNRNYNKPDINKPSYS